MINKYSGTEKDIHKKIFHYVVVGFKVIKKISRTPENIPVIKQVAASLTSIGANDREADVAASQKDFVAKYGIVKKETWETVYWWEVLQATGFQDEGLNWLISEGKEIFNIICKIIQNSRVKD